MRPSTTPESVSSFKREDILTYMDRRYRGENVLLSVAGNIDPEDVRRFAEERLGSIGSGSSDSQPSRPSGKASFVMEEKDVEQVHFSGTFRIDKLPFFPTSSKDVLQQFESLPSPKALAVKAAPPRYVSATGKTLAEAERQALANCNDIKGTACLLYAANDLVVLPQAKTAADL